MFVTCKNCKAEFEARHTSQTLTHCAYCAPQPKVSKPEQPIPKQVNNKD